MFYYVRKNWSDEDPCLRLSARILCDLRRSDAHCTDPESSLHVPVSLESVVRFGGSGVFLFFVISGFSLSMTMSRHLKHSSPMISYGLSRFFRIAPLFYVLLVVTLIRDHFLFHLSHSRREIVENALFLFNFLPGYQLGIVWASWTIGIEMIYYCFFPLLYRLGVKQKLGLSLAVMLLYCALVRIFSQTAILFLFFFGYVPIFVFGELAFHFSRSLHERNNPGKWGYLALASGIVILLGCVLSRSYLNPIY